MSSELDLKYLEELSGGDKDFINEMIETFVEETPKDVAHLKEQLEAKEWVELGKTAHKLKSSVKMFGFPTTTELAFEVEQDGKNEKNPEALSQKSQELIDKLQSITEELKAKL